MRKKIFNMVKSYQASVFVALVTLLFFAQTTAAAEEAAEAAQKTSLFQLVFVKGGVWCRPEDEEEIKNHLEFHGRIKDRLNR